MIVIDVERTGEKIKILMVEKNLTVNILQKKLGFSSPWSIYKWFNGKNLPTIDNLVILSDILNCKLDDIIITKNI